jgi:hypothetical protein
MTRSETGWPVTSILVGPERQTGIIYFPKNQVTPNIKLTVFMPEFGK